MKTAFQYRGYDVDCAPRETSEGKFVAQVVVTKIGFHPEKAFRALPEFGRAEEAVAFSKKFAESWLDRSA
jgi:hypothetical protein